MLCCVLSYFKLDCLCRCQCCARLRDIACVASAARVARMARLSVGALADHGSNSNSIVVPETFIFSLVWFAARIVPLHIGVFKSVYSGGCRSIHCMFIADCSVHVYTKTLAKMVGKCQ